MAVYGFWAKRIDELAEALSQVLEIRLYRQFSPMIGTWYTDEDLCAIVQARKEGKEVKGIQSSAIHCLQRNLHRQSVPPVPQ